MGKVYYIPSEDSGSDSDGLHIGDSGGASPSSHVSRERGLETGFSWLSFKTLYECRFFSANVRSGSCMVGH
jgi:hypothetical protein